MKEKYLAKAKHITIAALLSAPLVSHATVVDTSSVPIVTSTVAYCGITNVDNLDFVDIPVNVPVIDSTTPFDIDIDCPAGNYTLHFPGNVYGAYKNGKRFKFASTPGGSHIHSTNVHNFTSTGTPLSITFYGALHDPVANTITPKTATTWSGTIGGITLTSVP